MTNNPTQWCAEGRNINEFGNDNRGSDDENEGYLRGRNGVEEEMENEVIIGLTTIAMMMGGDNPADTAVVEMGGVVLTEKSY